MIQKGDRGRFYIRGDWYKGTIVEEHFHGVDVALDTDVIFRDQKGHPTAIMKKEGDWFVEWDDTRLLNGIEILQERIKPEGP